LEKVENSNENLFPRKSSMLLDFATVQKFITRDMTKNRYREVYFLKYSKEQVLQFIQNPSRWQRQLREISNNLYNISPQYKKLINYYVTMPTFAYIVEPYGFDPDKVNVKTFKQQYRKILDGIENMNIKHEFAKIMQTLYIEDVFYGYEHSTKDTYFIQKLDPLYCTITSIEDGCYNFSFNFQYFDTYPDRLEAFPEEFKIKYDLYKTDATSTYLWQELDSAKTICIKVNEHFEYPFPPFAGVFESIIELQDYKALRKSRVELENYQLLFQKLPMREDSETNNDFMIDYDNMIAFHNQLVAAAPDNVGVATSPMEVTSIDFKKTGGTEQSDNVWKATRELWDDAGVSQLLGNTDSGSSIGLNRSINTDESQIFMLLRQFERWLNKKARKSVGISWRVHLLNVTNYNQEDFFNRVMTSGEFGFPVRSVIAAALGLTPSSLMNMSFLENDVLGLSDTMIPLQSAHTTPNDGEDGQPKKAQSKLSASGAKSRDNTSSKKQ
jgi:hypothetical protein